MLGIYKLKVNSDNLQDLGHVGGIHYDMWESLQSRYNVFVCSRSKGWGRLEGVCQCFFGWKYHHRHSCKGIWCGGCRCVRIGPPSIETSIHMDTGDYRFLCYGIHFYGKPIPPNNIILYTIDIGWFFWHRAESRRIRLSMEVVNSND